jgi:DNA-binding response OmpR family regulator
MTMKQTVESPLTGDRAPSIRVALLPAFENDGFGEQLVRQGMQLVAIEDELEFHVRATLPGAAFDVAIVVISEDDDESERLSIVPTLARTAKVIVMHGPAGDAGESNRMHALCLGADDAVPTETGELEMLCRIRALLRRGGPRGERIVVGDLEIDGARWEARLRGEPVELTPTEFELLQELARRPRATHLREDLLGAVWDWPDPRHARTRTLDLHASRLRQKLARDGDEFVIAVRGVGYRLLP